MGSLMKKELNKTKSVFEKKSKMSLAKSTTALTCLVGLLIIFSESANATSTTTRTGTMDVATSIARSCTISAGTMTFAAYTGLEITAESALTINCTNGVAYSISLSENANPTPDYYLYLDGTPSATESNQLKVRFTHTGGTMTGATTAITGTGIGDNDTSKAITGTLAERQTGKTAGSFTRQMTLNIVY
jgi:spore coat protein U-like protein